jgi:endonuclease YncB( thermonuclease family)
MFEKIKNMGKFLPQIIGIFALIVALINGQLFGVIGIITFSVCAYLAAYAHKNGKQEWSWILAIAAIIYNPIFKVKLDHDDWGPIIVATIILLAINIIKFRKKWAKPAHPAETPKENSHLKWSKWFYFGAPLLIILCITIIFSIHLYTNKSRPVIPRGLDFSKLPDQPRALPGKVHLTPVEGDPFVDENQLAQKKLDLSDLPDQPVSSTPPWLGQNNQSAWLGKIERIIDGDTLDVSKGSGEKVRIRLYGIDAPELKSYGGIEAKSCLENLIPVGEIVIINPHNLDRYGHLIAEVSPNYGRNIGHEMLKAGHARWSKKYAPNDKTFEALDPK